MDTKSEFVNLSFIINKLKIGYIDMWRDLCKEEEFLWKIQARTVAGENKKHTIFPNNPGLIQSHYNDFSKKLINKKPQKKRGRKPKVIR